MEAADPTDGREAEPSGGVRWGWVALGVVAALLALLLAAVRTGTCVDYVSDAASSGCTSSIPWLPATVAGGIAVFAFVQAFRRRR